MTSLFAASWLLLLQASPDPITPKDLEKFPSRQTAEAQKDLYRQLQDLLEKRSALYPHDYELKAFSLQAKVCYNCWDALYYAQLVYLDEAKVIWLQDLKARLGSPDAYRTGRMPFFPDRWLLDLPKPQMPPMPRGDS